MRKTRLWAVPLAAAPLLAISVSPVASAAPAEDAPADDCPAIELIVAGSDTSQTDSDTLADVIDQSVANSTDSVALHVIETAHAVNFEGAEDVSSNVSLDKEDAEESEAPAEDAEAPKDTEAEEADAERSDENSEKRSLPAPTEVAGKDDPRRNGNVINLTDEFKEQYLAGTDEKKEEEDSDKEDSEDKPKVKPTDELEAGPAVPDDKTDNVSSDAGDADTIKDKAIAQMEQRSEDCPDTQFVLLGAGEGAEAFDELTAEIQAGDGPIDEAALAGTVLVDAEDISEEQAAADKESGITRINSEDDGECTPEDVEAEERETHGLITSIHDAIHGKEGADEDARGNIEAAGESIVQILQGVDPAKVGSIATNAAIMAEAPNPQTGSVLAADVLAVASGISNIWHDDPNLPNLGDFADLLDPQTEIGKQMLAGLSEIAPHVVKDMEEGVAIARAVDTVGVDRVLEVSSAIADQSVVPSPTEWEAIGQDVATIMHTLGTELDDPQLVAAAEKIKEQGSDFSLDSLDGIELNPGTGKVEEEDC